jgi:hypothetical protein
MATITNDLESVLNTLRDSIKELESIKKALDGKTLTRLDDELLNSYLMNIADDVTNLTSNVDVLTWAASGPGGYKLEYIKKVYKIGCNTIESDEKPIIKLEA